MKKYTRHGLSRTPTYKCWRDMITRCTNQNNKYYSKYGGRGIKVCDSWLLFINFYRDMGLKPVNKTLDRINNNGNYEPSNCRWATVRQQNANKTPKYDYLGIRKRGKTYEVTCCHKYIGTFKTLEEAIEHRKKAEEILLND